MGHHVQQKTEREVIIREIEPAQDPRNLDRFVSSYLELFNDPANLTVMSFTHKPWEAEAVREWAEQCEDDGYRFLIAVDPSDHVVGIQVVVISSEDGFELQGVAVMTGFKRQGIGRALNARAVALAAELGFRAVDARVFVDNTPALMMMLGEGFLPVGLKHNVRADGCDLLYLRKYLTT